LNYGFSRHSARARAAFFIEKIQDFSQRVGVRGIPKISAFSADIDEADLLQLFEVVGERGSRDTEFILELAGDHSGRVSGEEQAENLEARFGAESGEAVGGACDEQGIGPLHISMIAEIWKHVNSFLLSTFLAVSASYKPKAPKPWKRFRFRF
jgi:hypothetical protein